MKFSPINRDLQLGKDIEEVVSIHTQSDCKHRDTQGYIKTTAARVKSDLESQKGYSPESFCPSTINNVLNRLGYTLKKVRKILPLKRVAATEAIFANIVAHRQQTSAGVFKISLDVKDKVKVGKLSRKGYSRDRKATCALDKDQQWEQSLVPLGILEIDSARSTVIVGNSRETSDFIVDGLEKWYELRKEELTKYHTLEIYLDNGPSVGSTRTQFVNRMMEFACITNLEIHLLYYPPYHSKYNPIERVWAALENYWNGTLLTSVEKVINTIANATWKKIPLNPVFIDKVYQKGIKLSKKEMKKREALLERNQKIPKWDVIIKPSFQMGRLFIE